MNNVSTYLISCFYNFFQTLTKLMLVDKFKLAVQTRPDAREYEYSIAAIWCQT